MSSEPVHPNRGNNQKRSRRNKNKQQKRNDEGSSPYSNTSFHDRPSTGRPGSPHRYFEDSYDVILNTSCGVECLSPSSLKEAEVFLGEQPSSSPKAPQPIIDGSLGNSANLAQAESCGNQVVHRHLNGLCIVTAGNVLEKMTKSNQVVQGDNTGDHNISISSIQYLVKVGKDSQSAKGKLRTKNKKQKRGGKGGDDYAAGGKVVGDHDGNVSPGDPLCQITLSNGTIIVLKCCVHGTVIELNHRLEFEIINNNDAAAHTAEEGTAKDKGIVVGGCPSLILKEPLLDGYLAVIMPTRGSFPPKEKN
mmetsp:Transcript_34487/g.62032  ORF Transcript_34487/g.62032 Transcript_34487/m.62032 type:complete len:305 (-) Transcript_34487:176-1090(-)|eukprot:CAMPEP_0201894242 /NCGR_PEP_ID=MMETSP0902-20130614/40345_1 /ASSEMBLY_ACC=CAM_ASM_000551 /TAXON_ID=420261 /ORGANISM="Thalassiosira antarctica, Strain CCMP982" /LENGTH=304 /DNA_ID=CAMNT_0048426255 /DNA_START=46 /DNA_END=960 /DNA_ORIENTATION=-